MIKFPYTLCILLGISFNISGCGDGAAGDTKYTALGASDTFGIGATPLTNGYAYLIEEGIEQRTGDKVDLDNLGIPGAEVGDIDNIEVQLLKITHPNLITLSTGANDLIDGDSIDGFESDLHGLLNKLKSVSPDAKILISNIPDLMKVKRFVDSPDRDVTESRIIAYNNAIARQAGLFNGYVVNLYDVPLDDSLVSDGDGFHPNDRGHRAIADEFLKEIEPLLPLSD